MNDKKRKYDLAAKYEADRIVKLKKEQAIKLGEIKERPLPKDDRDDFGGLHSQIVDDICAKYATGQYGRKKLAKMFEIDENLVSRILTKKNVKINPKAKEAIAHFDKGFASISDIIAPTKEKTARGGSFTELSKIDGRQSIQLANEIISIVSQRNPEFARGFQSLTALMLDKAHFLLRADDLTTGDIKNVASAMKDIDQTMSIFPKQPTIAQQFNFGAKQQQMANENQGIKFEIEILDGGDK